MSVAALQKKSQQEQITLRPNTFGNHQRPLSTNDFIDLSLQKQSEYSSSEIQSPQRVAISSKKQQFAKDEANQLIENEQKRRDEQSGTRPELARQLIQQKQHQVLLNEINRLKLLDSTQETNVDIKSLEEEYRNSVIGFQQQIKQEIEQLQYELFTQYNTVDNQRRQAASQLEENDIIEEVAQLNEKPHPQPPRPQSQMQQTSNTKYSKYDQIIDEQAPSKSSNSIIQQEFKKPQSALNFKSPDKPFIGQNINHQVPFQKSFVSPKVFYRNNFHKDSKFVEKQQEQQKKIAAQKTLNLQLNELVQSYDESRDPDKVEDMILELNRLNQRTKGIIPQQHQTKIQKYANEAELQKQSYHKLRQSRSPAMRNSISIVTPSKQQLHGPFGQKKSQVNVNSDRLKEIINSAESKVKQSIKGMKSNATSNLSSSRISIDRNIQTTQCQTPVMMQNPFKQLTHEDIKNTLSQAVNELNARIIAKFLKRKVSAPGEYELAYLLTLLAAILDDKIPMTGDKCDLMQKSWEEMCKQLSNHGKIVYALQKVRIVFDKEDFLKSLQRVQFLKKYDDVKPIICRVEGDSLPIYTFIEKVVQGLQQFKALNQKPHHKPKQLSGSKNTIPKYKREFFLQDTQSSNYVTSPQTQRASKAKNSPNNNSSIMRTPKNQSVESQLLKQKQMAIEKTYQLQLDQSRNIQQQESSAKKKQLEIARMKQLNKALQFRIEKEDKLRLIDEQKKEEIEHIKYTSQFRHRMNSVDFAQAEMEKRRKRESSIENQEFKRTVRNMEKEQQLVYYKEESKKSEHDLKWKERQEKILTEKRNLQIKQKYEQSLLSKVRLNENYLSFKEQDLDDRIKSQFESASHRFKQLQTEEEKLKHEMSILQSRSARKSQVKK